MPLRKVISRVSVECKCDYIGIILVNSVSIRSDVACLVTSGAYSSIFHFKAFPHYSYENSRFEDDDFESRFSTS